MHNDLVSIIMPMHNSASYVGEAITSVLKQTYPHWELLVIRMRRKTTPVTLCVHIKSKTREFTCSSTIIIRGALPRPATWA